MRKTTYIIISLLFLIAALTSCTGRIAANDKKPTTSSAPAAENRSAVKTGLSVIADASGSLPAEASEDGMAKATIDLVALTIDDKGVIRSCEIDSVDTVIQFDASGNLLTDPADIIYSKNELGEDYGMHEASSIDEEWDDQAEAMSDYAIGKTVEQLKGIAVDEKGKPTDPDLTASVTISVSGFLAGIEKAAENARHLGAEADDDLELVCITDISESISAAENTEGIAQTYSNIAAVSHDDKIITSCIFDAVQINIKFDTNGEITDIPASILTKNELGRDYGMHTASTIDKDWNEQAAAFAKYITGKTSDEVSGISVDEKGSPSDPDLTASVTLSVGDFQALIAKADDAE